MLKTFRQCWEQNRSWTNTGETNVRTLVRSRSQPTSLPAIPLDCIPRDRSGVLKRCRNLLGTFWTSQAPQLDANHGRLTIHDTQEWYDLYSDKRIEELSLFFDHYLKGLDNGWESTPHVRVSLLGFNLVSNHFLAPDLHTLTDLGSPTLPISPFQTGHIQKLVTRHSSWAPANLSRAVQRTSRN